jgi:ATP-dependent DNA ligase
MILPYPMPLIQQAEPFDGDEWLYEIKHDGFRALAAIEREQCRLFSRKKHRFTGYQDLRTAFVKEVNAESALLDGELVVMDHLDCYPCCLPRQLARSIQGVHTPVTSLGSGARSL